MRQNNITEDFTKGGNNENIETYSQMSSLQENINLKVALDYAVKTHEYIKYLNQLTDQRANYLIVTASVLIASSINLALKLGDSLTHPEIFIAFILTSSPIFISILLSVRATLPKTFDFDSPMHTSAIAKMNISEYINKGLSITESIAIKFILRENHVVSKIIEFKTKMVKKAAAFLFIGIATSISFWIFALYDSVKLIFKI